MNPKKKAPAAQQLIDSLLDELPLLSKIKAGKGTAAPGVSRHSSLRPPRELVFSPDNAASEEVILDDGQHITIKSEKTVVTSIAAAAKPSASSPAARSGHKGAADLPPIPKVERKQPGADQRNKFKIKNDLEQSVVFSGELGGGDHSGDDQIYDQGHKQNQDHDHHDQHGHVKIDDGGTRTLSNVIDITKGQSKSRSNASSLGGSNSLHVHSLEDLEARPEASVDLLVESVERLSPEYKTRVLPKSESTPRSELNESHQVEARHADSPHDVFEPSQGGESRSPAYHQDIDFDLNLEPVLEKSLALETVAQAVAQNPQEALRATKLESSPSPMAAAAPDEASSSASVSESNQIFESEDTIPVIAMSSYGLSGQSIETRDASSPSDAPMRAYDALEQATQMLVSPSPSVSDEKKLAKPPAEPTGVPLEFSKQGPLDSFDRMMQTEIRPGAARAREQQEEFAKQGKENLQPAQKPAGGYGITSFHSAEASLKQSESLRIAQSRISDLEHELERLRRENEKLGSAGDTLRRHSDELRARAENAEQERRESDRIRDEERKVMRGQMLQKDRENNETRQRLEEAEGRLESNFKKIRVRERELEHRLEIMKMESATLVSTKDKMILDLKRQMDQLIHENEYGKQKAQEAFNQYKGKQETIRRVVRALRIALTILEGDDENVVPSKKAE